MDELREAGGGTEVANWWLIGVMYEQGGDVLVRVAWTAVGVQCGPVSELVSRVRFIV